MATQLAPHEVLIEHPKAPRPLTVLHSAYLAGKYPGWTVKALPDNPVDSHRIEERGLADEAALASVKKSAPSKPAGGSASGTTTKEG